MAVERIGIFSDIHGNAVAFDAVLAALQAGGVERLVCLGDVAATGPQPREVIQRLRALGCPVVMGNTDDHLLAPIEPESGDEDLIRIRELDHWGADQLSSDERAFLASFTPTVTLPLANGGSLLCYHGTPRSFNELLLPTTPTDEVDEALEGVAATVLAGGHTHQQMLRRHREMLILNPGSVGLSVDSVPFSTAARNPPWAEFAVLTSGDDGSIGIALRASPSMSRRTWRRRERAACPTPSGTRRTGLPGKIQGSTRQKRAECGILRGTRRCLSQAVAVYQLLGMSGFDRQER